MKLALSLFVMLLAIAVSPAQACENEYAKLEADFEGGRMSFCKANKKSFEIRIDPEDQPINPSPWYAFRVTPKQPGDLKIIMRYSDAAHRYRPKRSDDGTRWQLIDEKRVRERRKGKKVILRLAMEEESFLIAAQEMLLTGGYNTWTEELVDGSTLQADVIGNSVEGRSIVAITSKPATLRERREHVLLLGRAHPPELTGAFAMLTFMETVFSDKPLAIRFRERFEITAVPLLNPDGVANGNWRHNMNGVDLNRDWGPFTQPETQAVKKIIDEIAEDPNSEMRLMLDFHSTRRNVFYTQFINVETTPPRFTDLWIASARERLVGDDFERAERETTDLPTSKNYIHRRFGAPAITYELGDQTDRRFIRHSSVIFAEEMMETLLASDPMLRDLTSPPEQN